MPTYDYVCNACDHRFELFQSITAGPKRKCPECGRLKLRRLIGPGAAIVFKGSGFYQTDYRSASYKKGADAETKSHSNGDSNGKAAEKKSDEKSKAKTGTSES
ncbi:MAG: FmdB family transcriptional regulator [Planctomycetes bacterium RBG_16_64_12]|nr:MAG: FmdB family transcriptional regulator [Planctomycetes bacterium RBG_16_64_12]